MRLFIILILSFSISITIQAQQFIRTIKLDSVNYTESAGFGHIPESNEFYIVSRTKDISIFDVHSGKLKQKLNFSDINNEKKIQQITNICYINNQYYVFAYFNNVIYITDNKFRVKKKILMNNYANGEVAMKDGVWASPFFSDDNTLLIPTNIYDDYVHLYKELILKELIFTKRFKHPRISANSKVSPYLRSFSQFIHPKYGLLISFPFSNLLWSYDKYRHVGKLVSSVDNSLELKLQEDINNYNEQKKFLLESTYIVQTGYVSKGNKIFRLTLLPANTTEGKRPYTERDLLLSVYSVDFKLLYEKKFNAGKYFPYAFTNKNGFYLLRNDREVLSFDFFYL